MKRNQKKEKKSRRPLKKLIALWVVFAMLVVPFANHVGKDDAKAEGEGVTGVKPITDSSVGVTVDMTGMEISTDDDGKIVPGSAKETVYLLSGVHSVTKLKLPELKINEDLVLLGVTTSFSIDDSVDSEISSSLRPLTNGGETDLQTDSVKASHKIGIYAKAQESDTWKLQYVVNISFLDTVFTGIAGLYSDNAYTEALTDDQYVSQAYMGVTVDNSKVPLNTRLKYYVRTGSAATSEELANAENYDRDNNVISADGNNNGKKVYAYAALISDGDSPKVLEYKSLGSVQVTADTKAPTITCTGVTEQNDEGTYSAIDKNNYFVADSESGASGTYYGASESYQYTFSIKDEGETDADTDITGVNETTIKAKLYKLDGVTEIKELANLSKNGDDTWTVMLPKADADDGIVKVTASDNIGNEGTGQSDIRIKQAPTGTTIESVKLDGDDFSSDKILPKLEVSKKLIVTLKSDEEIDAVSLTNASSTELEGTIDQTNGYVRGKDRVYTITATFDIPEDVSVSRLYDGYRIAAQAGSNSVTIANNATLAKIVYDAEAPQFTAYAIQQSTDGNGNNWTDIDTVNEGTSAQNGKETYVKELNTKYRYAVKVSDAGGSDITKLKVYDASDATTAWAKDGDYFVSGEIAAPAIGDTTTIQVIAEDEAGNKSDAYTLRSIKELDTSFIINVKMKDANGNELAPETIFAKKFTNQKYTLSVTAESAYAISEIGLYANSNAFNETKKGNSLTEVKKDPKTHRHSATAEFVIPAGTANTLLEQLYVQAKNSDADQTKNTVRYPEDSSKYLGDVLYDQTAPILDPIVVNEWKQSYTATYHIKSGAETVESNLSGAAYAITGSRNDAEKSIMVPTGSKEITGTIDIPESTTPAGTALSFTAKDQCENSLPSNVTYIKVDKTRPTITFGVNGKMIHSAPIEGDVVIKADVGDNLTINTATLRIQGPDVDKTVTLSGAIEQTNVEKNNTFTLDNLLGKKAADGAYTATVYVADKAGNDRTQTISFVVDNTIPVVTAKIADGTTAGKQPGKNFDGTDCDYFYRSNVSVLLTYEDDNLAASGVVVTDNGTKVNVQWTRVGTTNKYQGYYTVTRDGAHTIKINAKDQAGNDAVAKQIVFIKDTVAPAITAVINGGMIYNESMGEVDLTSNSVVAFSVNDANEDVNDFNYQLIKTLPDQNPVTADVIKTDNRSFGFSDEADYVVKAYSVDKAGNRGAERTVQFRIDKTAPELQISGSSSGATLNSGTTLTFSMTEAFWRDASGTITITRKASDSAAEATYKTIDFKPTGRVTTMTETLSETGEYKVTFTGKDRAGHTAEAPSYTVRIDTGKPIITLSGVSNNDKTTKQVEFQAQIEEDFYLTKSVSIQATRTYLDTTSYKEKTEDLQITGYNPTAATTLIRNTFTEDGVYKILVTCKDAAGNEDTQEVSFTIDKTKPVIDAKVLAAYEGTLTKFAWDYDLNDIIYDLTVCDVHMYLNGSEYDGTSEIEDGAYEMKITAEDELGNKTEETVNFKLDTKAPTFIVTGVEDGEIKNEQYDINVSLQLDEDTLDEVSLNGSPVEIKDNAAAITVTEKGDYKLTMKAHDDAGNEAEKTISFTYGEKSHVLLYVLIGVGTLVIIGGAAAFIIAGKKKKND